MLAKYAHDKGITNKHRWKWSRTLTKQPQKLQRMLCINAGQMAAAKCAAKYKFGVQIPEASNAHPQTGLSQ